MRRRTTSGKRKAVLPVLAMACVVTAAALGTRTAGLPSGAGRAREAFASAAPEPVRAEAQAGCMEPLDVPFVDQREEWPTGCESVCAVMALNYAGVEMEVEEFVDGYLPIGTAPYQTEDGTLVGCDPRKAFPGDPRTDSGWGCYAPVIEGALQEVLADHDDLAVYDLSGAELSSVWEQTVRMGRPALVWVTIDMEEPRITDSFYIEDSGEVFEWVYPMHCMILTGKDEDGYIFNDPMRGKNVHYEKNAAEAAYRGLGCQALAVGP